MTETPFPKVDRLAPGRPFPPYSYVPGMHPHPIREMAGHSFGIEVSVSNFDSTCWNQCDEYLFGMDLFNSGYYWEAHESWEAVWIAAGRTGLIADFLKGLIKLAAAGVKAREGNENGVRRHAARAARLFGESCAGHEELLGLRLNELVLFSRWVGDAAPNVLRNELTAVRRVWGFVFNPVSTG